MGLGGACQDGIEQPCQVLANIPLDIPAGSGDPNAAAPHFVYRVIETSGGRMVTADSNGPQNLRTFATVDEARACVLTGEFQNLQKMITPLKALD